MYLAALLLVSLLIYLYRVCGTFFGSRTIAAAVRLASTITSRGLILAYIISFFFFPR